MLGGGSRMLRALGRGTGSAQSTGEGLLPALALSLPPKDSTGGGSSRARQSVGSYPQGGGTWAFVISHPLSGGALPRSTVFSLSNPA